MFVSEQKQILILLLFKCDKNMTQKVRHQTTGHETHQTKGNQNTKEGKDERIKACWRERTE